MGATGALGTAAVAAWWKWDTVKSWFSSAKDDADAAAAAAAEQEKKKGWFGSLTGQLSSLTGGWSEYLNPASYSAVGLIVLPLLPDLLGFGKSFWNYTPRWQCKECGSFQYDVRDSEGKRKGCQEWKRKKDGKLIPILEKDKYGEVKKVNGETKTIGHEKCGCKDKMDLPLRYKTLNFFGSIWARIPYFPGKLSTGVRRTWRVATGGLTIFSKIGAWIQYWFSTLSCGMCCGKTSARWGCPSAFPGGNNCCGCIGPNCFNNCSVCSCNQCASREDDSEPAPPGTDTSTSKLTGTHEDNKPENRRRLARLFRLLEAEDRG